MSPAWASLKVSFIKDPDKLAGGLRTEYSIIEHEEPDLSTVKDSSGKPLFIRSKYGELFLNAPIFERIINTIYPSRIVGSTRYLADSDGYVSITPRNEQLRKDIDIMLLNSVNPKTKNEVIAKLIAELEKYGIVKISQNATFVKIKFSGYEKDVELHIMDGGYLDIIYYAVRLQIGSLRTLQQEREDVINPLSSEKIVKIYLSVSYYFGDPELYARRLREYLFCESEDDFTRLKDSIFQQDLDLLSERIRGFSNEEMYEMVIERLNLRSSLNPFPAVESPVAQTETSRIHSENLKIEYMPTIPDKTILCHIITDSIVPVEQQNMLKVALEQNMEKEAAKGVDYKEGFACLSGANAGNPDEYIKDLRSLMQRKRDDYKALGYTDVRFNVACPDTGLVNAILGSNLGVKALAFESCKESDFNLTQVEGIMLALRALESGNIEKLKSAFTFLAGTRLSPEQSAITDIDKFIKTVFFILPAAKIEDYNERRRLNDLITTNIRQAA